MMTQLGPLAIHASPVTVRCGRSLWWCWSVFVGLLLLGCSPGAAPDGDAHEVTSARASSDTLEKELGGPARLLEFFLTRSDDEIRNKLAAYGMRFERHPDTQPAFEEGSTGFGAPGIFSRHLPEGVPGDDRDTCPKFYLDEPQHDNTDVWHEINGEVYYVDWRGRPGAAYSKLPPVSSEPRKPMCQSNVGRWGASEDASQSFDGGHLIGSQLGGWGFRANLVPQNRNFNRGNWLQLENAMTKCASLSAERMVYRIAVNYGQGADRNDKVVPLAFNMKVDDQTGPDDLDLHFANANYGGANGTAERQRGLSEG
jgi:hypothetical protein